MHSPPAASSSDSPEHRLPLLWVGWILYNVCGHFLFIEPSILLFDKVVLLLLFLHCHLFPPFLSSLPYPNYFLFISLLLFLIFLIFTTENIQFSRDFNIFLLPFFFSPSCVLSIIYKKKKYEENRNKK